MYFTVFIYISCKALKKASQYLSSTTVNTSSRSLQMRQLGWGKKRRLRKEERCQKGPTKPGLSSLTQMEREALAPIVDCSGASQDTITFLPLTKPRHLAKATCGQGPGPPQLTYHLNQQFHSRSCPTKKLIASRSGFPAANACLPRHVAVLAPGAVSMAAHTHTAAPLPEARCVLGVYFWVGFFTAGLQILTLPAVPSARWQ